LRTRTPFSPVSSTPIPALIAERATKEKASIAGMKNEDPSKQTKDESRTARRQKPAEGGESRKKAPSQQKLPKSQKNNSTFSLNPPS
jgi:hypothetical protein